MNAKDRRLNAEWNFQCQTARDIRDGKGPVPHFQYRIDDLTPTPRRQMCNKLDEFEARFWAAYRCGDAGTAREVLDDVGKLVEDATLYQLSDWAKFFNEALASWTKSLAELA
jgi:hypothetical protein